MGNGQWSWVMVNGVVMVMGFMVLNEDTAWSSCCLILFFICLGMSIRETVGVIDSYTILLHDEYTIGLRRCISAMSIELFK